MTLPEQCPYLPGESEQKLFLRLEDDENPVFLNDFLTRAGFRRSQGIMYKPACQDCNACVSARVVTSEFQPSRTQRKVLRRNIDLERRVQPAIATYVQYRLLRTYLDARHTDSGMADMSYAEYQAMVEDTPVNTSMVEYWRKDDAGEEQLIAACLLDNLADGPSMIYSFYAPGMENRSLGSFMVMMEVHHANLQKLPYVYLGYWISNCDKMNYKTRFQPVEGLIDERWQRITEFDD